MNERAVMLTQSLRIYSGILCGARFVQPVDQTMGWVHERVADTTTKTKKPPVLIIRALLLYFKTQALVIMM